MKLLFSKLSFVFSFILFIPLFFSLQTFANTSYDKQPNNSGFLPISSQYFDQGTKQLSPPMQGSLLLFSIKDGEGGERLFGVTAAHVTQGPISFAINGRALSDSELLGRLANNDDDIEIFEFKKSFLKPLAIWDPDINQIKISKENFKEWQGNQRDSSNSIVKMNLKSDKLNILTDFVMKGEWVKCTSQDFIQKFSFISQFNLNTSESKFDEAAYLPVENEIYATAVTGPGMSGSPFLTRTPPIQYSEIEGNPSIVPDLVFRKMLSANGYYFVIGINKSCRRHLPGCFFAPATAIANLVNSFLSGKRGYVSETRWNLRYGLTYRSFDKDTSEVFPLSQRVGGFTSTDGGGFTSTDGGGFASPSCGDFNDSLLNFNKWIDFQITPGGFRYKNRALLGFKIYDNVGFYIEGNPHKALNFFNPTIALKLQLFNANISNEVQEISFNSDFISLFLDKYLAFIRQIKREHVDKLKQIQKNEGKKGSKDLIIIHRLLSALDAMIPKTLNFNNNNDGSISHYSKIKYKIDHIFPKIEKMLDSKNETLETLSFKSSTQSEILDISKQSVRIENNVIHFHIEGPFPNKDIIEFKLDRTGRLMNENNTVNPYFMPIIRVYSKNNVPYIFDLRSFFFVDTTRLNYNWLVPTVVQLDKIPKFEIMDLLHVLLEGPVLRFKAQNKPQQYEIQFDLYVNE